MGDDSYVKLIDFGLAKRVSKDEVMTAPNGTPYYIAPEVLDGKYDEKCDVWSIGVITFIILCGCPPFNGSDEQAILDAIRVGKFQFKQKAWKTVSKESKDFIRKLLIRNPLNRLSAEQAL